MTRICTSCSVKPVKARGLCAACYWRLARKLAPAHSRSPHVDEIAVERACYGDPVVLTIRERAIAISRLTAGGLTARDIGERLRLSIRSVQRYRAGQVVCGREVA